MKIEKIEITKQQMAEIMNRWVNTEAFNINENGAEVMVKPISKCSLQLPVGRVAAGTLQGFLNYLFDEFSKDATMKSFEEKMKKIKDDKANIIK